MFVVNHKEFFMKKFITRSTMLCFLLSFALGIPLFCMLSSDVSEMSDEGIQADFRALTSFEDLLSHVMPTGFMCIPTGCNVFSSLFHGFVSFISYFVVAFPSHYNSFNK